MLDGEQSALLMLNVKCRYYLSLCIVKALLTLLDGWGYRAAVIAHAGMMS